MPPNTTATERPIIYRDDIRYCPATRYGQAHAAHGYRVSLDAISGYHECPGLAEADAGHPFPARPTR